MMSRVSLTFLYAALAAGLASGCAPSSSVSGNGDRAPLTSSPAAPDSMPVDEAVTIGRLQNGLTYYIRENRRPENRAELRLVVNAGSVLEDEDQLGLAHFVEHMAFAGTKHFERHELVRFLELSGMRFGPHLNAYTGVDETVYMLRLPTDRAELLGTGFQILEDWAHGITFDTSEIRRERGVVIEEWRGRRGAQARIADMTHPVLFRGSRYAERLPIGTRESLESFEPDALRRFYRDWYRPDLMAVVAVGDFDTAEAERLIRQHFEAIPARADPRPRSEHALPRRDSAAAVIATDPEATRTQVTLLFFGDTPDRGTVAAYRTALVSGLYTQMLNVRLGEIARTPDAPFLAASAGTSDLLRTTEAFTLGAVVTDTGVERGLEGVLTEVERAQRHAFTEAELERAKRNLIRAYERAHEERESTESQRLAGHYVQHFLAGRPIPSTGAQLELVRRLLPDITLQEVHENAADWLLVEDRAVVLQAPEQPDLELPSGDTLLALVDRVRLADVAAYEETVADAPLISVDLPEAAIVDEVRDTVFGVTTWTLANGVRVIAKPTDFKSDEVLFSAYSPGGLSQVPDSLFTSGLAAAQVVSAGGVGEFSVSDLQRQLAGVVARANVNVGHYHDAVSGAASTSDLQTLFELIHLRFTAPRADTAAFQAMLGQFRATLANRAADPNAVFSDSINAIMTEYHPRRRPFTPARVDSIDLGQAMHVYRDRFSDASDFTFVFVGSFSLDALRPLVQRYLGSLPSLGRREEARDDGVRMPAGIVEREVRMGLEPRSQTTLVFSGPLEYKPAERFALATLADVLTIRLREQLREGLGATYGVQVGATPSREPRPEYTLSIGFGSDPARADDLVAVVSAQIDSLRTHGASAAEVVMATEMRVRERETVLRQNDFWVAVLSSADRYGESLEEVLDLESQVASLTSESVRRAAMRYLDPERFVRVTLLPADVP